MNFLDNYETTLSGTSTPPQQPAAETSLNDEVTQVIGQLGRFWGGFRKQSQTALEIARRDLGDVVIQAQKELSKFTAEATSTTATEGESSASTSVAQDESASAGERSIEGDTTPVASASIPLEPVQPTSPTSQSFFSRLQSSLPPNIVSTVQANLPESLRNASQNIDLTQLRTNLSSEFQRVQGVTFSQAEEYVANAMREAGEVLRDAVKVIPPEEAGVSNVGTVWDGTDVWMLPAPSSTSVEGTTDSKGKGKQSDSGAVTPRRSGEVQRSVATRAESLLKQLKYDPAVIRSDPETEESVKALYTDWVGSEVDAKGGILGSEWGGKIAASLADGADGEALKATHDALVPSILTQDIFWKHYFFRVQQVEQEEERRKAVLKGSVENDEEFSWEDDEEDTTIASPKNAQTAKTLSSSEQTLSADPKLLRPKAPTSQAATSATTSPRLSSEDSYDLVSSGNVSATGETKPKKVAEAEEAEENDDDDDEESEEDEDEDEDEEDEEDEEEDWE